MGAESDLYPSRGFSDEPQVTPPRKPFYRRGGFIFLVVVACLVAAIVPPLVVFRDRLGRSSSPFADPPFWNGTGPNNNPFGTCFTTQATAFQPYWKEQQDTTWCGTQFNRSSPIFALPLLNMSEAVGADERVTHDVNRTLWTSMTRNWCGAEAKIQGPAGEFNAILADASTWRTADLNMALFEAVKGTRNGTYRDPDQAGWIDQVRICFTGNRTDIGDSTYPYSYPLPASP